MVVLICEKLCEWGSLVGNLLKEPSVLKRFDAHRKEQHKRYSGSKDRPPRPPGGLIYETPGMPESQPADCLWQTCCSV